MKISLDKFKMIILLFFKIALFFNLILVQVSCKNNTAEMGASDTSGIGAPRVTLSSSYIKLQDDLRILRIEMNRVNSNLTQSEFIAIDYFFTQHDAYFVDFSQISLLIDFQCISPIYFTNSELCIQDVNLMDPLQNPNFQDNLFISLSEVLGLSLQQAQEIALVINRLTTRP